jgi:hypothetical protein
MFNAARPLGAKSKAPAPWIRFWAITVVPERTVSVPAVDDVVNATSTEVIKCRVLVAAAFVAVAVALSALAMTE